jgi:formylglycine-generating enzyme required for sulfatase activity
MSFKEQLEQLKAARKAGLLDDNAFRRAKQRLFVELKTGVVAPYGDSPLLPGQRPAAPRRPTLSGNPPRAADPGDMNFKDRLEQLKTAHGMGLLDETEFHRAKQALFTELKTGVVNAADAAILPSVSPPARKGSPDDAALLLRNRPGGHSKALTGVLLGVLLIALAGAGLSYLGRRQGGETVLPAAIPAQPRAADSPQAAARTVAEAQTLQRRAAQQFGLPVVFQDALEAGGQGPQLAVIPAGDFRMGAAFEEGGKADERPHRVGMRAFAISLYPIQFQEYERFTAAQGLPLPDDQGWGRGQRPVIDVSGRAAQEYAAWLSAQTGRKYRLPTEAEWEYAARAGTATAYHVGSVITTEQANFDGRRAYAGGVPGGFRGQTFPVGQFPGNAWGLFDVHGNVWSWTCSVYDAGYQGDEQRCADTLDDRPRAVRGGAWSSGPEALRAAARFSLNPDLRLNVVGFRVVRELRPLREASGPAVY